MLLTAPLVLFALPLAEPVEPPVFPVSVAVPEPEPVLVPLESVSISKKVPPIDGPRPASVRNAVSCGSGICQLRSNRIFRHFAPNEE